MYWSLLSHWQTLKYVRGLYFMTPCLWSNVSDHNDQLVAGIVFRHIVNTWDQHYWCWIKKVYILKSLYLWQPSAETSVVISAPSLTGTSTESQTNGQAAVCPCEVFMWLLYGILSGWMPFWRLCLHASMSSFCKLTLASSCDMSFGEGLLAYLRWSLLLG